MLLENILIPLFLLFFFNFYFLFIWLHWVSVAAHKCLVASEIFRCSARALDPRLSSYSVQAWLPSGLWALSSPTKDQATSPVFEGRFLTTGPAGKSLIISVFFKN